MKKNIKTEIIAVGTELLLGQIANTNAQWMSEQLAMHGVNTFYHTVVGDNLQRLVDTLAMAKERSDVIIITGGLGPTEDDMSREAFHQLSHLNIVEEPKSMQKIKAFFEQQGTEMTPNNKRQARVFEHSQVLYNKYGMAPGNIVEHEENSWIFLPGVPREMKQLFSDDVIPYLKSMNGEMVIQSIVLRFTGIGESALEHRLQHLISSQQNPTIAPLAQNDGVTIRLTAKADTKEQVEHMLENTKQAILQEVGHYFYGMNNDSLEEKVFQLLQQQNKSISSAESLTGGLFANKLVSLNGTSSVYKGSVICYDKNVKLHVLHVDEQVIEEEGTVSVACAEQLAKNIATTLDTSIGISFTGVAGPDTLEGKDVGTVHIGLYDKETNYSHVESSFFPGDRMQIRSRSVLKGYEMLLRYLNETIS